MTLPASTAKVKTYLATYGKGLDKKSFDNDLYDEIDDGFINYIMHACDVWTENSTIAIPMPRLHKHRVLKTIKT